MTTHTTVISIFAFTLTLIFLLHTASRGWVVEVESFVLYRAQGISMFVIQSVV